MVKWIIERPTTYYGFLSGLFMAVATGALSDFALAATAPTNLGKLVKVALVSFGAAVGWFTTGEYVTAIRAKVYENQGGVAGPRDEAYRKAIAIVAKDSQVKVYALILVAIACSLAWPFV
jgi:hypothetical protein